MNMTDAYKRAQQQCAPQPEKYLTGRLSASHGFDASEAESIECLLIMHDYVGNIPDLSLFPKLRSFRCTRMIPVEYLMRQDMRALEELSISLECEPSMIQLDAPSLEKLSIYIHENDSDQMDMFKMGAKTIDLRLMPNLKKILLRHCTGYDIVVDSQLVHMEEAVYDDYRYGDFSHLRYFPNLKRLTIAESKLTDVPCLKYCHELECLDLSYNGISDADALCELPTLKEVNLYRNPLLDIKQLRLKYPSSILSAHDRDVRQYLRSLNVNANHAYSMVQKARESNAKRSPFLQGIIDRSTDEESFARYLESFTWDDIKRKLEGNKVYRTLYYESLSPEEMLEMATKEYPFIASGLLRRLVDEKHL